MDNHQEERELMVEYQIKARGVMDRKVLDAIKKVPRHRFVPLYEQSSSYSDSPLPIGHGQTISQPYIVAYMTELLELKGEEKVLELGTGCGYQTAVLAEIVREVYTIEIIEVLGKHAKQLLTNDLNYANIFFRFANGRDGWSEHAPFDRILLTAAPPEFPENLFEQLADEGIAVAPVGDYFQRIIKYRKLNGKIKTEALIGVSFVPFV
ncbi:MAG: protein-L-isoaspartate(D-aspartate) O-methyltransferase [Candidatus Omnitrophota bacterium]